MITLTNAQLEFLQKMHTWLFDKKTKGESKVDDISINTLMATTAVVLRNKQYGADEQLVLNLVRDFYLADFPK